MRSLKRITLLTVAFLLGVILPFSEVRAEEDFASNEAQYSILCSGSNLTEEEKEVCTRYAQYLSEKSDSYRESLAAIEENIESIKADIANKVKEISGYEAEINTLAEDIKTLNTEIEVLQVQIDEKKLEIETKEQERNDLMEKIKSRMENAQGTMRLNQYVDFIMGAQSFTDLIRRINGINDLMSYDDYVRQELVTLLEELNADRELLEEQAASLEAKKSELQTKQTEIMTKKAVAEELKKIWIAQEAEWEAQGNKIIGDLNSVKEEIKNMGDTLGEIPASSGWSKPVPSYAYKTAGTWHYPASFGGGVHLGLDLGYGSGTPVYAVANGVVIKSVDGCSNNGYYGNTCGGSQGGSSGGGNQIYMLARVDGMLYAIKYLHLKPGTLVSNYTTVTAGDKIAEMGGSGNSTGPHLHIEIFKLGNYTINEYIEKWDGNLSFGCGWGSSALNRTCDKSGSPCRLQPEDVLNY